jgi:hypothetical protein
MKDNESQRILVDSIRNDQNYAVTIHDSTYVCKTTFYSSNIYPLFLIILYSKDAWSPLVLVGSPNHQLNRFSTPIPCSFESWLSIGGKKTISEHRGYQLLNFASLGVDDPVGHRLDIRNECKPRAVIPRTPALPEKG